LGQGMVYMTSHQFSISLDWNVIQLQKI